MTQIHAKSGSNRRRGLAALAAVIVALLAAGCQMPATAAHPTSASVHPTSASIDPCADRLHDFCGRLLLYYSLYQQLPPTLQALQAVDPEPMPPPVCPTSGQPYVYNRAGLQISGRDGLAVLYDAVPVSGMRWCVMVEAVRPGEPLTARVLPLPDLPVFSAGAAPSSRLPAMETPPKR